jgi:hypothetical protein
MNIRRTLRTCDCTRGAGMGLVKIKGCNCRVVVVATSPLRTRGWDEDEVGEPQMNVTNI